MNITDLKVIGRLGRFIDKENKFQLIGNDCFQPALLDSLSSDNSRRYVYLIFTEHRVFYVEVKDLTSKNSKYWISFKDDGIFEEFSKRNSCKVAIAFNDYKSFIDEEEYVDFIDFKVIDSGEEIGLVVDYMFTGASRVLIVEQDGKEFLIPDVDYYVDSYNEDERIVYMKNTKSLREL